MVAPQHHQPRVAIVGGGIAGTLASLVIKNRGVARPTILDAGRHGLGGRLRNGGAQFLRPHNPALTTVCSMLENQGLLAQWKGRFGVLGTSGGGFLPAHVVTTNSGMQQQAAGPLRSTVSDGGDFCHFVDGSRDAPTYVGVPSMQDLCPEISKMAGIDAVWNARVVHAEPLSDGWNVHITDGTKKGDDAVSRQETFDALVLATHDASFVSRIVHSIVDAEVAASDYANMSAAIVNNESIVVRLLQMAEAFQMVRNEGRMPVYTTRITYPRGFSQNIPFDAVSVPGSHLIQFLARDDSKPNDDRDKLAKEETWTAISTSSFADGLLSESNLADDDRLSKASNLLSTEMSRLLSPFHNDNVSTQPLDVSTKQWRAAFTSKSLGLKEDSIALAPWRLAICGDFIREMSVHATPLEAAALSGLEAGERTSSFFQQQPAATTTPQDEE